MTIHITVASHGGEYIGIRRAKRNSYNLFPNDYVLRMLGRGLKMAKNWLHINNYMWTISYKRIKILTHPFISPDSNNQCIRIDRRRFRSEEWTPSIRLNGRHEAIYTTCELLRITDTSLPHELLHYTDLVIMVGLNAITKKDNALAVRVYDSRRCYICEDFTHTLHSTIGTRQLKQSLEIS